jgi:hypothetical protein
MSIWDSIGNGVAATGKAVTNGVVATKNAVVGGAKATGRFTKRHLAGVMGTVGAIGGAMVAGPGGAILGGGSMGALGKTIADDERAAEETERREAEERSDERQPKIDPGRSPGE